MSDYFMVLTEHRTVSGICDYDGLNLAWVFDDKDIARSFLKDFKNYWPYTTVTNFTTPTEDELLEFLQAKKMYPIINPKLSLLFTEAGEFVPCIIEGVPTNEEVT